MIRSDTQMIHVIAHRGASAHAPENTLAAFEVASELGVVEVELDVQLSRDGVLFLFHDRTLDRKTSGSGSVRDHDAAALRAMEIGSWFDREHSDLDRSYAGTTLSTFAELIETFGKRFYYHVEIKAKDEAIPRLLFEEIRAHDLVERVTVTSFLTEQLERVRRLDAGIPICRLVKSDPERGIEETARAGYEQIAIRASELTPERVARAQAAGLEVRAFGVRSDADVERALAAGVTGMTVDAPDRVDLRGRGVSDPPARQ